MNWTLIIGMYLLCLFICFLKASKMPEVEFNLKGFFAIFNSAFILNLLPLSIYLIYKSI